MPSSGDKTDHAGIAHSSMISSIWCLSSLGRCCVAGSIDGTFVAVLCVPLRTGPAPGEDVPVVFSRLIDSIPRRACRRLAAEAVAEENVFLVSPPTALDALIHAVCASSLSHRVL